MSSLFKKIRTGVKSAPNHDGRRASILLVDDDELVLSSLRGVFTLQTDYDVIDATDPQQAIQEVERVPVDVVISDFLMPQMNGIDFLKEVRVPEGDVHGMICTETAAVGDRARVLVLGRHQGHDLL